MAFIHPKGLHVAIDTHAFVVYAVPISSGYAGGSEDRWYQVSDIF